MSAPSLAFASPPPALPPPRAFGCTPADLALDFDQPDRTALTTAVLARCCTSEPVPAAAREDAAWSLPLGARIARLLCILRLTTEDEALATTLRCSHDDCRHDFAIALPFAALAAQAADAAPAAQIVQFPLGDAAPLTLRLPTGRDQAAWRERHFDNQDDALTAIVRSLAVEPAALPDLAPDRLAPLAAAMEAADPLVAFTVETTCAHCHRPVGLDVDLEGVALQQLARLRREALRDVHELATHYGWTEPDVLAIPPRRRAEYQRLIAATERSLP
jgi:hypothetical protein